MKKIGYKFYVILLIIVVIGIVGKLVPYGYENWNFLFENMIWFPIEISLTVFVIDRLIQKNESKKEVEKFISLAGNSSHELVSFLKRKLTSIVVDARVYDASRDDEKLFTSILENPDNYINSNLIAETRTVNYMQGTSQKYNYIGFIYDPCIAMHNEVEKYLDYYKIFMPAKYVFQITELSKQIYNVGFLMNTTYNGKLADEFKVDDSNNGHKKNLVSLCMSINKLENSINEMSIGKYENK